MLSADAHVDPTLRRRFDVGGNGEGLAPTCDTRGDMGYFVPILNPQHCAQSWCFVDANDCSIASSPTTLFDGLSRPLHYSYASCAHKKAFAPWWLPKPTPPPSPSPPPSPLPPFSPGGGLHGDPHLNFARGLGRADFRGRHGALYNFLSTPGLTVSARFETALFRLHRGRLLVNGTFVTEVHIAALVGGAKRKWANLSYWASELNENNWGWKSVSGTCGGHGFKLGPHAARSCEELHAKVDVSAATIEVGAWKLVVHGNHVYDRLDGPYHRLDLEITRLPSTDRAGAHGLIGQSFAWTEERDGAVDHYPKAGKFTTSAQAEGAIDGQASDYEMVSPYATDFTFSRFLGSADAAPSLEGTATAESNDEDTAEVIERIMHEPSELAINSTEWDDLRRRLYEEEVTKPKRRRRLPWLRQSISSRGVSRLV
jgi:hypothetical protein